MAGKMFFSNQLTTRPCVVSPRRADVLASHSRPTAWNVSMLARGNPLFVLLRGTRVSAGCEQRAASRFFRAADNETAG
jgi:hypothetical protein